MFVLVSKELETDDFITKLHQNGSLSVRVKKIRRIDEMFQCSVLNGVGEPLSKEVLLTVNGIMSMLLCSFRVFSGFGCRYKAKGQSDVIFANTWGKKVCEVEHKRTCIHQNGSSIFFLGMVFSHSRW